MPPVNPLWNRLSPLHYVPIMSTHIGIRTLAFVLLSLIGTRMDAQSVQINEFLASNVRDYPEMYDFGDYEDWIELHNPGGNAVDLGGYFLSDDPDNPLKWAFPAGAVIPAQGYLIVWADDFDEVPGQIYTRETWPYETYTTRHYHTNFKLSKSGETLLLAQAEVSSQTPLVSAESMWKYHDSGSDPGIDWVNAGYDDSEWGEGLAELGYGDGDENTVVEYGPDSDNKYITTYFRKIFQVSDPQSFDQLKVRLKRDDGARVFLNGEECVRSNLPAGEIHGGTEASSVVGGDEEDSFYTFSVSSAGLLPGSNCVAVEIHQINGSSSDISFDLELVGLDFSPAVIVDEIDFGEQLTDVSYGRISDGSVWSFHGEPSPGLPNGGITSAGTLSADDVQVSQPSGMYPEAVNVTLSTLTPGAEIRYTMDGSRPLSSSPQVLDPLHITESTILKARAFAPGYLPGPILTVSYLIGEPHNLPSISLIAEPPTLWDSQIGIYENEFKQREIPVTTHYFATDGTLGFSLDAGSRLGGLNIWTKPQKPFTIYTRGRFGDDPLSYQLFQSKAVTEFSRFVFRNGGDDWEETLLRDPMTGSLIEGMMDCGYMAYEPAALYLNGEYWGLYNIREKYDPRYFFENFGVDPNNIDHLEYGATQSGTRLMAIEGDLTAYEAFISFILTNDLDEPHHYAELRRRMNIDGFIDHVVMTLYCANTSWGHNREWWRPRTGDQQWQWLIVDVDRGFNPSNLNTNLLDNLLADYLLFQYLMSSQRFQNRFLQRAAAHFNQTFKPERVNAIVDSLSQRVRGEMPRHIQRWGGLGGVASMDAWDNELQAIKDFAQARSTILFDQFSNELGLDGTVEIQAATYPAEGGRILINGVPLLSENETGSYFRNQPMVLTAQAAPGWEVIGWSGVSDSAMISYDCGSDASFIALFQPAGGILLPELLSEDMTLNAHQRYYIPNQLRVPQGISLHVEPGVDIQLSTGAQMLIEGVLEIAGTEAAPVSLAPNLGDGSTSWGGIAFTNPTDTSRIKHLELSGGTRGIDPIIHRGAISGENAHLIIDGLNIHDVRFPIYIEGGSIQLTNSQLRCAYISDYINVKRGDATIDNCVFYGNEAPDTDAIDLDGVEQGLVSNNRIYDFSGPNSDGIDIGEEATGVQILRNLIYHSSDKGISVGQSSHVDISENLFVGCKLGIAVKDGASANSWNNTFANNEISVAVYEKNAGAGGGTVTERNSILFNSLISPVSVDAFSSLEVSYSLSNTQVLQGTGNLLANPRFVDAILYDFELSSDSPALDAGDPDDENDPDGSPRDMGAYYSFSPAHYPYPIPGLLHARIRLNEFLASNGSVNMDEAGDFDDWVELFNPTDSLLDLSGCYLTDNPDNLTKWEFPEGVGIEAGGYLLVWCDDEPQDGPLHSNFKLSASGEFLALVLPNGLSVMDSLSFGPQTQDVSFGRVPDGEINWLPTSPTPGSSNHPLSTKTGKIIPTEFALYQNYPNPFNPLTVIRYDLPRAAHVNVRIFDVRGSLVKTLQSGEQTAGAWSVTWDGSREDGRLSAAGIYLYSIDTESFRKTRKLLLLK